MKAVSRFEYNLLRILHFFLGRVPLEQARPLVSNRWELEKPKCLSRTAVDLVQEALAKGCVEMLARGLRKHSARSGGWRRERFLRDDQPREGRLWERTPPTQLGLAFSGRTLDFLLWVTLYRPVDARTAWTAPPDELLLGDQLLLFFAYHALRDTDAGSALRSRQPFMGHGLCRLMYPEDFAANQENPTPDFGIWTTGVGASIVEAFQGDLAERWLEGERLKSILTDWQELRALGRCQEQVLNAFLTAAETAHRLDLTRFLLQTAAAILVEDAVGRHWIQGLQTQGPRMADRMETNQAALAFVRQMERLRRWERQARGVGYFDEGYARSQLFLADWERHEGDTLFGRAQAVMQQLDPMRQRGTASPPTAERDAGL